MILINKIHFNLQNILEFYSKTTVFAIYINIYYSPTIIQTQLHIQLYPYFNLNNYTYEKSSTIRTARFFRRIRPSGDS